MEKPDEEFLVRAYLLKPDSYSKLSSLEVAQGNFDAHDAIPSERYQRLQELGYIVIQDETTWHFGNRGVDVAIFRVTPLGKREAERLLGTRVAMTSFERFRSANWAMWGGLSAIVAAIASIIGAIFAYLGTI